jgi:hypothetical protein
MDRFFRVGIGKPIIITKPETMDANKPSTIPKISLVIQLQPYRMRGFSLSFSSGVGQRFSSNKTRFLDGEDLKAAESHASR